MDDQILVCSDLSTDNIVEAIIEKRDATNDQASRDEKLAEEPSVMTTREAVAAFDAQQIYISSLPNLAPQYAVNLHSIRSVVVAHSVRPTVQNKIVDFLSPNGV